MEANKFVFQKIWFDATRMISRGMDNPTGIDRVEIGLIEYAMRSTNIGIAVVDRRTKQITAADERTMSYIRFLLTRSALRQDQSWIQQIKEEFKFLDVHFKFGNKSNAGRWAVLPSQHFKYKKMLVSILKPIFKLLILIANFYSLASKNIRTMLNLKYKSINNSNHTLILSYFSYSNEGYVELLRKADVRLVHIIYDLIPILHPNLYSADVNRKIENLFKSVLINNELSIAISETVRDELSAWNDETVKAAYSVGFRACKLSAPISLNDLDPAPVALLAGKRFAMCVSTFDQRKGYDFLVRIWGILAQKLPTDVLPDLVLIGRTGGGLPAFQLELQKNPHIANKVHIFHNMNDSNLVWCYQNTVLGVFASSSEGWGLSVSEFLSHRVPVVHSDISILHEAAQNLMPSAPVGDSKAWVAVISDILLRPQKLADLITVIDQKYEAGSPQSFANCLFAYLELHLMANHRT